MATDANTGQPIFQGSTKSGLRNAGSYQVSGHPFVTGAIIPAATEVKIQFPYVTKKVTIIGSGSGANDLRVYFIPATVNNKVVEGHHYISLDSHEDSVEFDLKCNEMYIQAPKAAAGYQLYASLTLITGSSMFTVTGSGIDSGAP